MALQSSGEISLGNVNTELGVGATATIAMNDAAPRGLAGISSGQISMSDFYGKASVKYVTAGPGVSFNVDVRTALLVAGWDQTQAAVYTIPSTSYLTSSATSSPGLAISGSFPKGLTIINNGYILGRGGTGGYKAVGNQGGVGLAYVGPSSVTVYNYGLIAGGGGGGGGGLPTDNQSAGGGAGGSAYGESQYGAYYAGYVDAGLLTGGVAGTVLSPPYGGYGTDRWGYPGGNGGGPGQAGSTGSPALTCFTFRGVTTCTVGYAGGAAGYAYTAYGDYYGTKNLIWGYSGDIRGPIIA